MSVLFQQLHHIIIQQIKPPNKSFNLNREILSKLWLKSLKIGSTLLWWRHDCGGLGPINILFLEWKFYVKILTTTEVIQKNVLEGGGGVSF